MRHERDEATKKSVTRTLRRGSFRRESNLLRLLDPLIELSPGKAKEIRPVRLPRK